MATLSTRLPATAEIDPRRTTFFLWFGAAEGYFLG